jgi:ABC-type metal ion transport system substrate-binding protein
MPFKRQLVSLHYLESEGLIALKQNTDAITQYKIIEANEHLMLTEFDLFNVPSSQDEDDERLSSHR